MFRTKKSIMFLLTVVMAVSAAAFISTPKAKAANSITILIDGQFFQPPDAQPYITNNRVMVPFRPIAEAMGAAANWDETSQTVSVSLGNKSVKFVIGSTSMDVVTVDANGGTIRTNVTLDAPATLVNNNRAFVPIRALSEGLGATVQWVAESGTVIITSNAARATPTPVNAPTPALNPAFATTQYFEIISGTRAQTMYDNVNHEVLLYFNSSDPNAVSVMPAIMSAAATVGDKVYGVDISTSPNLRNMNWVYNYVTRGSNGPALFFMYNINQAPQIIPLTTFTDQNLLNAMFQNWYRNVFTNAAQTPTVTPTPTWYATPTPTVMAGSFGAPFIPTTKGDAENMYYHNESFVLVYFDSSRSDLNQSRLDMIKQGVYDANLPVYYFDEASRYADYSWFGSNYYSYSYYNYTDQYSRDIPNPTVFFVDSQVVNAIDFRSWANLSDQIQNFRY